MRYRITFVAGFAIGYILGAKAGKQRYEQIARFSRRVADNPAVQEAAGLVGAQVANAGRAVKNTVTERIPVTSLRDFLDRPTPEEATALAELETDLDTEHSVNGSGPRA